MRGTWTGGFGIAAVVASVTLAPSVARAEPVSATGKGIAGGALLGAEVVMITEAIIGVESWWPYLVFGAVGAGGGAVGGYFVETAGVSEPSLYMFAGGLALVVPALVVTLNATAYNPESDTEEDTYVETGSEGAPETGEPAGPAEPATPSAPGEQPAATPAPAPGPAPAAPPPGPTSSRRRFVPLAALGLDLWGREPRLVAGVPNVQVRPTYGLEEAARYGLHQGTDVHVPVLTGRF
jgi:hypothetical protein